MSITIVLLLICVGMSLYAFNNEMYYSKWLFNPYRIKHNKEFHRFITSTFIHGDYNHLFFNAFTLYQFGSLLENVYIKSYGTEIGTIIFISQFLISGIIADLPTFFKYKNAPYYNSLGASGAVSSIIFSTIYVAPFAISIWFIPGALFGVGYLAYSYYMSRNGNDNINHDAHMYGALSGIVFTALLIPSSTLDFIQQIGNKLGGF